MEKYQKINTVFRRDNSGKIILGEFSTREFDYLQDNLWTFYEKIDGTNIRIIYDHENKKVIIKGKTDDAQIPPHLLKFLESKFPVENFAFLESSICLYGEGFGHKINKGGKYFPDESGRVDIRIFDAKINNYWLDYYSVASICENLKCEMVAVVKAYYTLNKMISNMIQNEPMKSFIDSRCEMEGVVGKPLVPLHTKFGGRIITKIKYKDFK